MEKLGAKYHRERLGEAIREEISTIVEGELGDPRIGLVSVSEVQLAADGRSAHVLVTADGNDSEAAASLEGLVAATGYIRRELASRLHLRKAPELLFTLDRSRQYTSRVEALLERVHKREQKVK